MCSKGVGNGLKHWKLIFTLLSSGHFWTKFGYVSDIPVIPLWCHCARRNTFGCTMVILNFIKFVWTVFENYGREKKRHECISSGKFIRVLMKRKPIYIEENQDCLQKTDSMNNRYTCVRLCQAQLILIFSLLQRHGVKNWKNFVENEISKG